MKDNELGILACTPFCFVLEYGFRKKISTFELNPNTTLTEANRMLTPYLGFSGNGVETLFYGKKINLFTAGQWEEIHKRVLKLKPPPSYPKQLEAARKKLYAQERNELLCWSKKDELIQTEGIKGWEILGEAAYKAALTNQKTKGFYPARRPLSDYLYPWEWGQKNPDSAIEAAKAFKYAMWELRINSRDFDTYLPIFDTPIPPKS